MFGPYCTPFTRIYTTLNSGFTKTSIPFSDLIHAHSHEKIPPQTPIFLLYTATSE